jgi:hypothetical protein
VPSASCAAAGVWGVDAQRLGVMGCSATSHPPRDPREAARRDAATSVTLAPARDLRRAADVGRYSLGSAVPICPGAALAGLRTTRHRIALAIPLAGRALRSGRGTSGVGGVSPAGGIELAPGAVCGIRAVRASGVHDQTTGPAYVSYRPARHPHGSGRLEEGEGCDEACLWRERGGQGIMQVIRRFTPCAAGIRRGSSYTEPRRNGRAAAALSSVPTNRA